MSLADLHFHSLASDGKHSVEELNSWLEKAAEAGLELAVLTDHDGVEAFDVFSQKTSHLWTAVRACELSTEVIVNSGKKIELHLLIYGIEESDPYLEKIFERFRSERENRYFQICQKIEAAGYSIATEEIAREHEGVLGRPHVADALVRSKVVRTRKEAFDRFLHNGSPYLVEKWRVPIREALKHCQESGYRSSLAHPGIYGTDFKALEDLKAAGLDGLEVVHPKHSSVQQQKYREMAETLKLFETGGSDFHDAETDQVKSLPSLGRAPYPFKKAEAFLKPFL